MIITIVHLIQLPVTIFELRFPVKPEAANSELKWLNCFFIENNII